MAEILDENTRLRSVNREQARALQTERAAREALEAQVRQLISKVELVVKENERLTKHFEFLEKQRELAKAERFIAAENQAELFADTEYALPPRDPVIQDEDQKRPDGDGRKMAKHPRKGRRDLSKLSFPKKVVTAPVNASACEGCGGDRKLAEPRVSHRIAWEPGRWVVHELHQQQCACPACPDQGVWTAPEPYLLPGAMCDDALLAKVIVDKFGDHLPLNRQASRMKRTGFPIGSNVLSGWVRRAAVEVQPLIKAIMHQVANAKVIQSDDSGFPVQDGSDGKLAKGRLWVFTDQQQAFFGFSRTKAGTHPADLLESLDVSGTLVADGGSEYNETEERLDMDRAGCWSHLRRYFHEAAVQHDEAKIGLTAIRDVFLIERDLAQRAPNDRLVQRVSRSQPVVDGFFDWVKVMSIKTRPKSKLGDALGYALSQEERMRLFLRRGDVPLHNNLSELLLRQPIVGRKNWLFARSEGGAYAAAGWFTLIGSCLLQGLDPQTYLYDVFRRLPDHPSKWVHELTPLNWRIAVDAGDIEPLSPDRLS